MVITCMFLAIIFFCRIAYIDELNSPLNDIHNVIFLTRFIYYRQIEFEKIYNKEIVNLCLQKSQKGVSYLAHRLDVLIL